MFHFMRKSTKKRNIGTAQIHFVQPKNECSSKDEEDREEEDFDDELQVSSPYYFDSSPSDWYYLTTSLRSREVWSDTNPVFMTNSGYQNCNCFHDIEHGKSDSEIIVNNTISFRQKKTEPTESKFEFINENDEENIENYVVDAADVSRDKIQLMRSASYDDNNRLVFKSSRRVSILVDELLLKIYGGRERRRSSGGTDVNTFECSTDSSNNNIIYKSKSLLLKKKHSFTGIPEDKCKKWNDMVRTRLMNKSVIELKTLKTTLEYNVSHVGSQLIRQLKRRDFLYSRRDAQCSVITAFLQAMSAKRSEDMKIQFSIRPNVGESGFQQWHGAMEMVARLSGGIPHEFRKTLWVTLAERHIISKNINWSDVERMCFNDSTNPDDEELGVQIVKDLHRTGCSLFCGSSGEENQAVLKRVLLAYARWNKLVGYCQGFNMLAALILEVMDRCEQNSLKVMIFLIEGVLPESYFANNLQGLSVDMAVFRDLLRLKLPELSRHLEQLQTANNDAGRIYEPPLTNVFTMQWFLTMFCNCLPHSTVLRVWDIIFLEGNQVLLKTALAIWDTLSDRIMPVKSADEFYSIMGVLTREMLEFGLMDANSLIKTIMNIELPELTELRERYIYNITPWTQVARKGLRLFYGVDDSDNSDDEDVIDDKTSEGAYGFLKAATRQGSQSIRSISPSSLLGPLANEKEKIVLDISALKKQYRKIKEHQRQAQIIFTAACNTHGFMGSVVSSSATPAINHLMLNKSSTSLTKASHIQKPPVIPVSRAVQRLKEASSASGEEVHRDRGETLYWDKRMKKKRKRRRTEINSQNNCCDLSKADSETLNDSDSSTTTNSSSTSSYKSSSSTELCDEATEFDSEDANTSLSECCSSPLQKFKSSTTSLVDDNKFIGSIEKSDLLSKQDSPDYMIHENFNNEWDREKILNLLLTTSIIASEQLNKQDIPELTDSNFMTGTKTKIDDIFSKSTGTGNVRSNEDISQERLNHFIRNINKLSRTLSDTTSTDNNKLFKTYSADNVSTHQNSLNVLENAFASNQNDGNESTELESALEHMKIDALEILFSSSTLNSIRDDVFYEDKKIDSNVPVPISEEYPNKAFQIDEKTELELKEILQQNTELLKKVNQNYTSHEPNTDDNECIDDPFMNYTSCFEYSQENSSNVNYSALSSKPRTEIRFEECDRNVHCDPICSFKDKADSLEFLSEFSRPIHLEEFQSLDLNEKISNFKTDFVNKDESFKMNKNKPSDMFLSPHVDKDFECKNASSNSSLDYFIGLSETENGDFKRYLNKKKHKSLDSLNTKNKSKLKIGLVSRNNKWISISIDNSDLVILDDSQTESKQTDHNDELAAKNVGISKPTNLESQEIKSTRKVRKQTKPVKHVPDPYLYLNFDIIPTRKKKKGPVGLQEYSHKKSALSQSYRTPELPNWNFSPFPLRSNNRPPKELGVKLGLYSSTKK